MAWLNHTTIRPASPSPTQLKNLYTVIIFVRFFIQKLCWLWFKQILWMDGAGRFCRYAMSFNGNRCTASTMSKIFCSIKDARFLYVFESIFVEECWILNVRRVTEMPIVTAYCYRLPLLIFPCTIKSRSSLLAPAHPGGPGKRAVKRLCW